MMMQLKANALSRLLQEFNTLTLIYTLGFISADLIYKISTRYNSTRYSSYIYPFSGEHNVIAAV